MQAAGLHRLGDLIDHAVVAAGGQLSQGRAVAQPELVTLDRLAAAGAVHEGAQQVVALVVEHAGDAVDGGHKLQELAMQQAHALAQGLPHAAGIERRQVLRRPGGTGCGGHGWLRPLAGLLPLV